MRPPILALFLSTAIAASAATDAPPVGYYRSPALFGDTLVFVAEGDLCRVGVLGGRALRLTSHPGAEGSPVISPDGRTIAFAASYEGPTEVYVMPLEGGLPERLTWQGRSARPVGWTRDGRVLLATRERSTLPATQLAIVDPATRRREAVPLAQASDGSYDADGRALFFTRFAFQGSHTKRYRGGTAQSIWRYDDGAAEATPLTADEPGTSRTPLWWDGRVVFVSDRDGTMNLWSMNADGGGLRQHTHHVGWDVASPSLDRGRVAYQLGADIHVLDLRTGDDRVVPITLDSDLDQTREHWIAEPMDYLTAAHVSADGDRIVLTARGQVFVAPRRQGRLVEAARRPGVRYREARFMPDGKSLVVLSDESGEVELWTLPANGVGEPRQLTHDGAVLRWDTAPSPDGRFIAHHDKDQRLWIYDVSRKTDTRVDEDPVDQLDHLRWSPDSRWLAYVAHAPNAFQVIRLRSQDAGIVTTVTSDRYDSHDPEWSPDGKQLYFLSERHLESLVRSPWGALQPEPFFDRRTQVYFLALTRGERSPFAPPDELHPEKDEDEDEDADDEAKNDDDKDADSGADKADAKASGKRKAGSRRHARDKGAKDDSAKERPPKVVVDLDGIGERIVAVPVRAANMSDLQVSKDRLFWLETETTADRKRNLVFAPIAREDVEVKTLVPDVKSFELSQGGKKLLVRKGDALDVVDASADAGVSLEKKDVPLGGWRLTVVPREEWRQMFTEAWRLERDYFYDTGMHGVDWKSMLAKYRPLVDRVSDRAELADLVAQMVSELSALHTFVYGGDARKGEDDVAPASLGARLVRDEGRGGHRVEHVYRSDPDEPQRRAPLAEPGALVEDGDVIVQVNGTPSLSVADIGELLRNQAGKQVLLRVKPHGGGAERSVIVQPITPDVAADLRYHEWEYTRRLEVERRTDGAVGYVHLRAMGGNDFADWARGFYPVFDRKGLIIDVRHNGGGNIDSWILGRLLRRAWFYWSQRVGRSPTWNMQQAFRGHLVVLCDESTASDGEAFTEGFKRLGLGKVIGTRTWGGEIWLTSSNVLVDGGIATAAEYGVYGPEGAWLIEGHGVEPDVVVDNLPHATWEGGDAQLDAAITHLQDLIRTQPVELPAAPRYPDKSFRPPPSLAPQ